jgi:hypothetical protein
LVQQSIRQQRCNDAITEAFAQAKVAVCTCASWSISGRQSGRSGQKARLAEI